MIRVHMLTWPVSERHGPEEERKLVDVHPSAERSNSFNTLKRYFSNVGLVFGQPRNTPPQTPESEAPEVVDKEPPPPAEQAMVKMEPLEVPAKGVKAPRAADIPVKKKKDVSRIQVLRMVDSMQVETESPSQQKDATHRRKLSISKQWENKAEDKKPETKPTRKSHGSPKQTRRSVTEAPWGRPEVNSSQNAATREAGGEQPGSARDTVTSSDGQGAAGGAIQTHRRNPAEGYVEEEEEERKRAEENVDTLSVQDMVKGFMYIKQNPNTKKVPKSFKKRTTVTLVKQ